jgi:hypothetical protein
MAIEYDYLTTPNRWHGFMPTPMVNPAGFLRLDEKTWKFTTEGEELLNATEGLLPEITPPSPAPDTGE